MTDELIRKADALAACQGMDPEGDISNLPADTRSDLADTLAAALRITRDRYLSMCHSEFDGVWNAEDFVNEVKEADAALAAWEARK